jgi:hypothetical protein
MKVMLQEKRRGPALSADCLTRGFRRRMGPTGGQAVKNAGLDLGMGASMAREGCGGAIAIVCGDLRHGKAEKNGSDGGGPIQV